MKRVAILLTLLLTLAACKDKKPPYSLSGQYGSGGDTLYIFGLDSRHNRLDTLLTDKSGEFFYRLSTDTLVPLTLVMPDGKMHPLYAEPNVEASFESNSEGRIIVKGGAVQMLYDSIAVKIDSVTIDARSSPLLIIGARRPREIVPTIRLIIYLLSHMRIDFFNHIIISQNNRNVNNNPKLFLSKKKFSHFR